MRKITGSLFQSLDGVLQASGGPEEVTTQNIGRVRTCNLARSRLAEETAWSEEYRQL
ncbi:hypothetical protein [Methylobacterium sp. NEAU K]|uniref:hypothetical protein n=1 Tax=Methylobacterium sp. NEAU K TaxID=3064946 RepID=UPI002734B03A|nr:hypothetical protein [Methylobacterium sp. NEAU K]MDP4006841.1 hypothetical protein [Methylobacterium sp. NEAU K]